MILMTETVRNRVGQVVAKYPMRDAPVGLFHMLSFERDGWVLHAEMTAVDHPEWKNPDWDKLPSKTKARLLLVSCCQGIVIDAKQDEDRALIPITGNDYMKYYAFYARRMLKGLKQANKDWRTAGHDLEIYLTRLTATNNRKLIDSSVTALVEDIKNCRWFPVAQGFSVDCMDNLQDGQHRLMAIKLTGWPPVLLLLVKGMPVAARVAANRGKSNTLRHILKMDYYIDLPQPFVAAANMSIMWRWRPAEKAARAANPAEVAAWVVSRKDIYLSMAGYKGKMSPAPVIAAFADIAHFTGRGDEVLEMYRRFKDARFEPKVGSAIWALRDAIPNLHVCTHGDKKSGLPLQEHRYNAAATAIFSFLDGDGRRWNCQELVEKHDQTRESLTMGINRLKIKSGKHVPDLRTAWPTPVAASPLMAVTLS